MNNLFAKYKKRFAAVNKAVELESRNLTIPQKHKLLSSLFSLGIGLQFNRRKRAKELYLKSNWLLLKT